MTRTGCADGDVGKDIKFSARGRWVWCQTSRPFLFTFGFADAGSEVSYKVIVSADQEERNIYVKDQMLLHPRR